MAREARVRVRLAAMREALAAALAAMAAMAVRVGC